MDIEAGLNENFDKYAESVVGSNIWRASDNRLYGATQLGQRFVLLLIFNVHYYVYQVVEPHEDSIRIKPMREFATFDNEESAREYMENRQRVLLLHNQVYGLNYFDIFVAEKLKLIWGRELYRIRDFDVDGNPFVVVLKKNFAYYSVVLFKDPSVEPQISITKCFSKDKANECVQMERNKLKETAEKVNMVSYVYPTKFKNEEIEAQPLINAVFNATEGTPDFVAFVNMSFRCSFRGEEVYRYYGFTAAGQQFCFVVSKIAYYIVQVVLEPNSRPRDVLPIKIKMHSRTLHLICIKNRTDADRYVAKLIRQAVDRHEEFFDDWTAKKYYYNIEANSIHDLHMELRRGDHIRRNLKVGCFKPTFHDGIYLGNGRVAHYTTDNRSGFFNSKGGSGPGIVSLETFLNGEDKVTVSFYISPTRSGDRIARIAEFLIENRFWDKSYHLLSRNCQLFALLCTTTKLEHQLQHARFVEMLPLVFLIVCCSLGSSLIVLFKWWIKSTGVAGLVWTSFIMSIICFILFVISIAVWCLQRKSVKETMKIFTELENLMDLGLI